MILIALILAAVSAVALVTALTLVVVGIQLAERRRNLPGSSSGCADAFARRVLLAGSRRAETGSYPRCGMPDRRGRRAAGHVR